MTREELIAAIDARQTRNKQWRGLFGPKSPIVVNEIIPIIELLDRVRAELEKRSDVQDP